MHSNHSLFNATPQVWTFFKYKIDEDDLEKEIFLVNFDLLMKKNCSQIPNFTQYIYQELFFHIIIHLLHILHR